LQIVHGKPFLGFGRLLLKILYALTNIRAGADPRDIGKKQGQIIPNN
jgi:hypothetical protein